MANGHSRLISSDGHVLFRSALVYEQAGMRGRALQAVAAALERKYSKEQIEKAPPLQALRQDPEYRKLFEFH